MCTGKKKKTVYKNPKPEPIWTANTENKTNNNTRGAANKPATLSKELLVKNTDQRKDQLKFPHRKPKKIFVKRKITGFADPDGSQYHTLDLLQSEWDSCRIQKKAAEDPTEKDEITADSVSKKGNGSADKVNESDKPPLATMATSTTTWTSGKILASHQEKETVPPPKPTNETVKTQLSLPVTKPPTPSAKPPTPVTKVGGIAQTPQGKPPPTPTTNVQESRPPTVAKPPNTKMDAPKPSTTPAEIGGSPEVIPMNSI